MTPPEKLPTDEFYVLCTWAVQAVAEDLKVSEDAARDLLEQANNQQRVQVLGNSYFAGVQVDGRWVVVEGRHRLREATREWVTLRELQRDLEQ